MNSLFEDITNVTAGKHKPSSNETHYIMSEGNLHAQMETVRLNESKKTLSFSNPSVHSIASAMTELAEASGQNKDEPVQAIKESTKRFAQKTHLAEAWKTMGKLVELAHKNHNIDLKEMIGGYDAKQIELMEMTLKLPWRLDYSEPVDVEVHDYPISQDHVFKGTEPEDVTEDEVEDEMEESALSEAKMSNKEILDAAKQLAKNAKDEKTKNFGQGLVDFYNKNKSFTPEQVGGLQNIMKKAGFQFAKESTSSSKLKKKLQEAMVTRTSDLVDGFVRKQGGADKALKKMVTDLAKSKYSSVITDYLRNNS